MYNGEVYCNLDHLRGYSLSIFHKERLTACVIDSLLNYLQFGKGTSELPLY